MPNIDLVKIAKIVVMLALIVGLLAYLVGLEIGGGTGRMVWRDLNTPPKTVAGVSLSWSPLSVATELLPPMLDYEGKGLPFNVVAAIAGIFSAALIAAFVVRIVKIIGRAVGS